MLLSATFEGTVASYSSGEFIMDTQEIVKKACEGNPDIGLVLEISARARDVESKEPPLHVGMATDTVTIPTNLQCPVPPETPC
jgi:hypothetical protein